MPGYMLGYLIYFLGTSACTVMLLALGRKLLPNSLSAKRFILIVLTLSVTPQLRLIFDWSGPVYAILNLSPFLIAPIIIFNCFDCSAKKRLLAHLCYFLVYGACDLALMLWFQYASPYASGSGLAGLQAALLGILNESFLFGLYMLANSMHYSRPLFWAVGLLLTLVLDAGLVTYVSLFKRK